MSISALKEACNRVEIQEPPEPTPLVPALGKSRPYPIEVWPEIARGAILAIAQHVQAPIVLAANSILATMAHLALCRVNAEHIHFDHGMPCSLFQLTLANSGDRKSNCDRLANKVVQERERVARKAWLERVKQAEHDGSPSFDEPGADPRTLYGSDASFSRIVSNLILEQPFASWSTDEGGAFFGGHSMSSESAAATLGGLVKLWDDGSVERDRSRGNADGSGFAYDRRFGISLQAQEVAVRQALANELFREQGFLPRFLFAAAESIAGSRFVTEESLGLCSYSDPRLKLFWSRCEKILDTWPATPDSHGGLSGLTVLPLSPAAKSIWCEYYNQWERQQGPMENFSGLRPFAGRAGEILRRLATVIAFFSGNESVSEQTMHAAAALVDYSLSEWKRYLEPLKIPSAVQDAEAAFAWLSTPDKRDKWVEFTKDQWGKSGPPKLRLKKRRDPILALLVKHSYLLTSDGKTFFINPRALVGADPEESAEASSIVGLEPEETLRTDAENCSGTNDPGSRSAGIRISSALEDARQTGVSAESAKSSAHPNGDDKIPIVSVTF